LKFPLPTKDGEVREIPLESLTTLETVVLLSREKADDYIRISVQTKDLKRKETVCQEVNEDEK
jgi:site-specific DNA recombinase